MQWGRGDANGVAPIGIGPRPAVKTYRMPGVTATANRMDRITADNGNGRQDGQDNGG